MTYRRTKRRTYKRKKTKSKSRSGYKPSVHNSMPKCVQLFKKYKLTNQSKMVKWVNHNHPDHANARGSKQSTKLKDDYKFITGCFANRKRICQAMKLTKTKSKSKSKSKKKVKKIKGGTQQILNSEDTAVYMCDTPPPYSPSAPQTSISLSPPTAPPPPYTESASRTSTLAPSSGGQVKVQFEDQAL